MAFLVVDVCEWSVCRIGRQTGRCWRELRKEEPNRGRLRLTKHSIFETDGPAFQWYCVELSCCMSPLKIYIEPGVEKNRLWTLHLACWVTSEGRRDLKVSDWRRGWHDGTDLSRNEIQNDFPIFLGFLCSPPPQARPDQARSMAPRGVSQSFNVSMLYPWCFSQPGGPRPRKYGGSVQWTGARQDLTSWSKPSQRYRPSSYQSVAFFPPPWPVTSNAQED